MTRVYNRTDNPSDQLQIVDSLYWMFQLSWGPDDNWSIPLRCWQKFLGRGRREGGGRKGGEEERREREGEEGREERIELVLS